MHFKRIQERLAQRSKQGLVFTKLYDLLRDKRFVWLALSKVLANDGAKTPGIDQMTRDDLKSAEQKERFVKAIWGALRRKTYQPSPVRRIYIPKPSGEQRPLGIPTLRDRVVQEMLRLILEPIYESKFYRHSYGFRPFRATHHAAVEIHWLIARHQYNYIVEGDICKCFDRIQQNLLLKILRRTIQDERILVLLKKLLRAGVMEDEAWRATDEGTPQGGVVSPLLANIYLNDLDWFIAAKWDLLTPTEKKKRRYHGTECPMYLVRYADDFVIVLKATQEQAESVKQEIGTFLQKELGLELSTTKTLVTPVTAGFDFLGFNIRKYQRVALIKPSRKATERFKAEVRKRVRTGFAHGDQAGILHLNRYLLGWGAYYRRVSSSDTFAKLDHYVWQTVWQWTERLRGVKPRNRSRRKHYARHLIPYRFDLHKPNRKSKGRHYGIWVDEAQTAAYIVTSLYLQNIQYVRRHPQLHPYLLDEREILARKVKMLLPPKGGKPDLPTWDRYGPEWEAIRQEALRRADNRCTQCGEPLSGRRATVHHKRKLKNFTSRQQAHRLENLVVLCPQCHLVLEKTSGAETRSA